MANRFQKYVAEEPAPEVPENRFARYTVGESARGRPNAPAPAPNVQPWMQGIASGVKRGVLGMANMAAREAAPATMDPRAPVPLDDTIRQMDAEPQPQGGGYGAGRFAGEMLATAPLGGGRVATTGANALTRVLGARVAPRLAEGAVSAGMYASPDQQGAQGAQGAILSATLGRAADAGGRVMRGVVKKSPDTQHLEHLAAQHGEDMHIPLSLAADPKDPMSAAVGGTYRKVAPMIPFVGGRLEGQREKARDQVRSMVLKEASPTGLNLTPDDLADTDQALSKISKEFIQQYDDTVKSYSFNVPQDLDKEFVKRIKAMRPNMDKATLGETTTRAMAIINRFADDSDTITGDNLLYAKRELSEALRTGRTHEKDSYKAAIKWIDDHIVDELSQGNSATNKADLQKYLELAEPWKAKVAAEKAAKKSPDGLFGPEQLASSSRPGSTTRVIGRAGASVLRPKATQQSLEGKILGGAILGGVGTYMGLLPAAALAAGGHVLANKSTQRFLTGDGFMNKYGKKVADTDTAKGVLAATRRAMAAESGQE